MNTKETIIKLLKSTKRKGMDNLISWLTSEGFFEGPASKKFHGCCPGGLAKHSLRVYQLLSAEYVGLKLDETTSAGQKPLPIEPSNIIIAALPHDVCKVGAYVRTKADDGWTNNRNKDKGHALLSIERIKVFIELTELEEMMIKYHMGVYGLTEFDEKSGEYGLRGGQMANAWFHNPIVKVMYFCDELATLGEKAESIES